MLQLHVNQPTTLDLNALRDKAITVNDAFKGKIVTMNTLPPIKLKKSATSLHVTKPRTIVSRFTHILGVNQDTAEEMYRQGARTVDELIKDYKKYNITSTQMNGCLYFNDLLTPITDIEEDEWKGYLSSIIVALDEDIRISSCHVKSRPNGIHSRIEFLLCVDGNCLDTMMQLFTLMESHIPDGMRSIFESHNDNKEDGKCTISRIKSIAVLMDKHIILDVTVYHNRHHPYPLLRDMRMEVEERGWMIDDEGLYNETGKRVSFRPLYGRDNAQSTEEVINIMVDGGMFH